MTATEIVMSYIDAMSKRDYATANSFDLLHHDFGFEFDSVQKCSGTASTVQVEITQIRYGGDDGDTFYFKVAGNGPFQMKSMSTFPDSRCDGAAILDTMTTQ